MRLLRWQPLRLALLVLSMGVAFGFVATVATVAHAVLNRLPAGVADQHYVSVGNRSQGRGFDPLTLADIERIRALAPEIAWFHATHLGELDVVDASGARRAIKVRGVSRDYFQRLGMVAERGWLHAVRDGATCVVVSAAYWRRYHAGGVLGEATFDIDDHRSLAIVGVAPQGFSGVVSGAPVDAWILGLTFDLSPAVRLLPPADARAVFRYTPLNYVFGVVPGAASTAALQSVLANFRFESLAQAGGKEWDVGTSDDDRLEVVAGLETNPDARREAVRMAAWLVAMCVLLPPLALVVLAGYLLDRASARDDEQFVRIAVGATPVDVVRQMLAEHGLAVAAMIAVAGGCFLYAYDVVLRMEPFAGYLGEAPTASVALGLGVAAGGLLTAFLAGSARVGWWISAAGRQPASRPGTAIAPWSTSALFYVAALCLLLVLSLAKQYADDAARSLGLANGEALLLRTMEPMVAAGPPLTENDFAALPSVRSVANAQYLPLAHEDVLQGARLKLRDASNAADASFVGNRISPGFFVTLGIHFVAGRDLDGISPNDIVLSRHAARHLAAVAPVDQDSSGSPEQQAVGRTLAFHMTELGIERTVVFTVVGVVDDVAYRHYTSKPERMLYRSAAHGSSNLQHWAIDLAGPASAMLEELGARPAAADADVVVLGTPRSLFAAQFAASRSVELVLAATTVFAFILAVTAIGFSLARSIDAARRSIGIRFALGATPWVVVGEHMQSTVASLLVAFAGAAVTAVFGRYAAPDEYARMVETWLLAPALIGLLVLCALILSALVHRLAMDGTVANTPMR